MTNLCYVATTKEEIEDNHSGMLRQLEAISQHTMKILEHAYWYDAITNSYVATYIVGHERKIYIFGLF